MTATKVNHNRKMVSGTVSRIELSGEGANSMELVLSFNVNGTNKAYALYSNAEAGLFSGIVTVLTAAYFSKTKLDLYFDDSAQNSPEITDVVLPSDH